MGLLAEILIDVPDLSDAKCKGVTHSRLFFPPRDRTAHETARRSKAICKGEDGFPPCPHLAECAAYALRTKQRHGIWGGMSERDRVRYRKEAARLVQQDNGMRQEPIGRKRRRVYIGGKLVSGGDSVTAA